MKIKNIFDDIEDKEKILKNLDTEIMIFHKNSVIINYSKNNNIIGIILNGKAIIEKYDYDGNRFIIDYLKENSLFGELFSKFSGDISIVAKTDCEVLLFDYNNLLFKNKNKQFLNNLFEIMLYKIEKLNIRIDMLSKGTIRDKLIKYFLILANGKSKKIVSLPFNYTELADYLCIDRSSMMREIKKMRDEGIIKTNGKKIKLLI